MANETRLPNGLTQRQFAFYNRLIEQMNETGRMDAKQAAVSAGYCSTSASRIATRLLRKPEGQSYLKSLQVKSAHSAATTMDWIMEKLVCTVRAGISDDGSINYNALSCSIRAISEINKIKGYYAPDKKVKLNMTMDDNIQEARVRELIIKYTREY
ncbi:terminase small subunit [Rickettsiella endosymbiont of Dermanyssus gallinae]|uniref:terminase small subunit n=1 Tax=Rickettsiella endosymbiont of Dermanyssus gallinae TaxID=2856608 RepID=UPI001C52B5B7|nr:terminase small subunit [Rickettsiella endosymbiont of Dermanyssus gallinae]